MGAFTSVGLGNVRPSRSRYKNAILTWIWSADLSVPHRRSGLWSGVIRGGRPSVGTGWYRRHQSRHADRYGSFPGVCLAIMSAYSDSFTTADLGWVAFT